MNELSKAGIHTVKHFKVSDKLMEKIRESSENYEGGQEQFLRDRLAKSFSDSDEISYGELMDLQETEFEKRFTQICGLVSVDTALFFADFENSKGFHRGFVAGEILERFANQREIPKLSEPVNQQPQTVSHQDETAKADSQTENSVVINLTELVNPDVIESLKTHGFDENRYITYRKEKETREQLQQVIEQKVSEKEEIIRNLQNSQNPQNSMELLEFVKILVKAHLDRNRPVEIFTKYTKESILEICPEPYKNLIFA
jgi:hypothetical protein